jgi:hypothetical protein
VLAIDHIVLPVADLALAATDIESRYGLASVEGGRHPAWGTANRIVPLGDTYLELVAVVDRETAMGTPFGSWIATARPDDPLGWAARTDAIEAVAHRLDVAVVPGSRIAPGGALVNWRTAGLDVATREPALPFFIQWGDGVPFPGAASVRHPGGPTTLKLLALTAEPQRLAGWLGEHDLPISVTAGDSALSAVVLRQGDHDIELHATNVSGRSRARS